jgi:hypothetical protein
LSSESMASLFLFTMKIMCPLEYRARWSRCQSSFRRGNGPKVKR